MNDRYRSYQDDDAQGWRSRQLPRESIPRHLRAPQTSRCHACHAVVAGDGARTVICDDCDELNDMDQRAHEAAHGPGQI